MLTLSSNVFDIFSSAVLSTGLTDAATAYVLHVLESFVRAEHAFSGVPFGEKPVMVDFLNRASEADYVERERVLRHVGDLALFTAGLFPESCRAVSRSYYVAVGEGAYGTAASLNRRPTVSVVLEEVSERFEAVADSLHQWNVP